MGSPTDKSPEWIKNVIERNPCKVIADGNILTCPVRMGFVHLDKPQKAMEEGKDDKYSVTLLFQEGSNVSVLADALRKCGAEKWGDQFANHSKSSSFHNPIKDQGDKFQYEGFVSGNRFVVATGTRKPEVRRPNGSPHTDHTFSGQWAMAVIRPFAWETRNSQGVVLKRGLSFGLQGVLILADDIEFGGGGVDLNKAFAGVQIDTDVNVSDDIAGQLASGSDKEAEDIFAGI